MYFLRYPPKEPLDSCANSSGDLGRSFTHDVVQTGNDTSQLAPMAQKAKAVLAVDELNVVADRGYFSAAQILECARANVTPTLPKTVQSRPIPHPCNHLHSDQIRADIEGG